MMSARRPVRGLVVGGVVAAAWTVGMAPEAAAQEELLLRLQGPETELTRGSEFQGSVLFDATVDGIQGWSFAVEHDPAVLELLGAEIGATTATVKEGEEPEFLVLDLEPGNGAGVALAVVISFTQPITLDAGTDYELLTMDYRVVADPTTVEPCEPIVSPIAFSSTLGDPPVTTVFTVLGETSAPATEDASVTVRCPGTIEFTRCEGGTDSVELEWTFGGTPEWDFLFLYRSGELVDMLEIDATSYTDSELGPGEYTYTLITFVVEDPSSPALLFDVCTAQVIPVAIDSVEPTLADYLGGDEITVTGTGFTTAEMTTLEFVAEEEEPLALEVIEVLGETELRARVPRAPRLGFYGLRIQNEQGSAELADAFEYGFRRGEANEDGSLDLSDAISILGFLFLGSPETLACHDAVDATDDGNIDLSDAIRILGFLFLGSSPPEAPFPEAGRDPTPDDLGCLDGA